MPYWNKQCKVIEVFSLWHKNVNKRTGLLLLNSQYKNLSNISAVETWIILARWHSAANSRPWLSDQASIWRNQERNLFPQSRVQSCRSLTRWLKSHMLMKWNICENSWIVRAALTLVVRRSDITEERIFVTASEIQ